MTFFKTQTALMGLLHMLVAFTAMAVVTQVVGFSLQTALLFAGIGTIVFHFLTKHKLPVVMGVSAAYIGGILTISNTYGQAYAFGGIISAGIFYMLFSLVMFKYQRQVMKFFPAWLLSTVILLIGLSLLPIGVDLIGSHLAVGLAAFFGAALFDLFAKGQAKYFALPFGILIGTVVALLTIGLSDPIPPTGFEFIIPRFNLSAILSIGLVAFPTIFEMLGDTKNTGDIIGIDVFEEVGVGRIALGNGLATIIGGLGGSNAYTTYSENAGFLLQTKYFNPHAQIWTGLFFILLSLFTPFLSFIQRIPTAVFGGVILYLFALITMNAVRQIGEALADNAEDTHYAFQIMSIMVALSTIGFVFGGVAFSSVAVATFIGVILHVATRH